MTEDEPIPTGVPIGNLAPDWQADFGIRDLWSEVVPNLWIGGTHDDDQVDMPRAALRRDSFFAVIQPAEITKADFDSVVTMYPWARPVDVGVEELRIGIYDAELTSEDLPLIHEAAAWAYSRWLAGRRVLIRCQAGLNRSALICALALVRHGATPATAIETIRAARSPQCLFNEHYVRYLMSMRVPPGSVHDPAVDSWHNVVQVMRKQP